MYNKGVELIYIKEPHINTSAYKKALQNNVSMTGTNVSFHSKVVAVLCECAFVDNNKDNDIIDTIDEQKAFGVAYAKAILEYLGIKHKNSGSFLVKIKGSDLSRGEIQWKNALG